MLDQLLGGSKEPHRGTRISWRLSPTIHVVDSDCNSTIVVLMRLYHGLCQPYRAERVPKPDAGKNGSRQRRAQRSTATVTRDGAVVPWLAAEGPLAYSPEHPPDRKYYFQYGWVLPEVFAEHTNRRRHYYFGAERCAHTTSTMFSLWAKPSELTRVACPAGSLHEDRVEAPIAVYRTSAGGLVPEYLLIQHGSYQLVHERDQPLLESGELTLYRGVQTSMRFLFPEPNEWNEDQQRAWRLYCRVQWHMLSDSARSFNSIHDRAKRCETEHIRDRSWITDDVARQHGLDIDGDGFTAALWNVTHQSFALERWVAERKFGPHYVVCRTPLSNVRMTTFFTGEHEVRIIDPRQVRIIETQGCHVAPLTWNSSP